MTNKHSKEISFCIPTSGRINLLSKAIKSILELKEIETIKYEILISDDSKDEGVKNELIKNFFKENSKIRYVKNEKHGQFYNLNNLVNNSKYDWLVFLHDDDTLNNNFLRYIIPQLHKNYDIIYTTVQFLNEEKNIKKSFESKKLPIVMDLIGRDFVIHALTKYFNENKIYPHLPMITGLMIKKDLVIKTGLFENKYSVNSDSIFIMKSLFLSKNVCFINKCLVNYRVTGESQITKGPSSKGQAFIIYKDMYLSLLNFMKPHMNIQEFNKIKLYTMNNFYKNALKINGPILWTALRYKGNYFKRLIIQFQILSEILSYNYLLAFRLKTLLIITISLLPKFILNYMYTFYVKYFSHKNI